MEIIRARKTEENFSAHSQRVVSDLHAAYQRFTLKTQTSTTIAGRWSYLFFLCCMIFIRAFGHMKRQKIRERRQSNHYYGVTFK